MTFSKIIEDQARKLGIEGSYTILPKVEMKNLKNLKRGSIYRIKVHEKIYIMDIMDVDGSAAFANGVNESNPADTFYGWLTDYEVVEIL